MLRRAGRKGKLAVFNGGMTPPRTHVEAAAPLY
jgi:hypothetical protein